MGGQIKGSLTDVGDIGDTADDHLAGNSDAPLHHSTADRNPHSDSIPHDNPYPWTPHVWFPLNPVLVEWAGYMRHIWEQKPCDSLSRSRCYYPHLQ